MQGKSTGACLAGLALVLALSASPAFAQSMGEAENNTIGFTTGKVEEEMPEVISGFALAAERGHLKVPTNKDAAQDPIPAPTPAPTSLIVAIDPCQTSTDNLSYFQPEAQVSYYSQPSAPIAVEVPFVYEVETNVEYSAEEMNSDVLPKVEQAIGDGLLPILFDECAPDSAIATSMPSAPTDGSIMGITTAPPDLVITDSIASCSVTKTQPGNSCTVIEGILTIYAPPTNGTMTQQESDALIKATQDAVREVMESGVLNDGAIDESIDSVTYGKDGRYKEPVVMLGTDKSNSDEGGGGFPAVIAMAGGVAVIAAGLAIVGAKMRKQKDDDEEKSDIEDDDDALGFHDNPTEIADRGGKSAYDLNPVAGGNWASNEDGTNEEIDAGIIAEPGSDNAGNDGDDNNSHGGASTSFGAQPEIPDENGPTEANPISPSNHEDALNRIDAAMNSGEWSAVLSEAKNIAENDDNQSEISDVPSLGASEAESEASVVDGGDEDESEESIADTEVMSNKLNDIV